VLVRCPRCDRPWFRAVPATSTTRPSPWFEVADVRPYVQLRDLTIPGGPPRVRVRCHQRCGKVRGERVRDPVTRTLRLDRADLVPGYSRSPSE
jgi:hypothetical protein